MNEAAAHGMSLRRRRHWGPQRRRGFTLVELTVALLAGLLVAMGIVALSREATTTFHEEARASAAEAELRTAVDRLRTDLARAGYMATGNILTDPQVVHAPGLGNVATIQPTMTGITGLAGILWNPGGSLPNGLPLSVQTSQTPPLSLAPDSIRIAGNFTSTEQFDVLQISSGQNNANCARVYLIPNAPAMVRFLNLTNNDPNELNRLFFPSGLASAAFQFIVRIVDVTGRAQYLATCPSGQAVAGFVPANTFTPAAPTPVPYVDVDSLNTPIITSNAAGTNGGITGQGTGTFLSAVQIVQWEITTAASSVSREPANAIRALGSADGGTTDPTKYDLMRSFIDAKGRIVPDTSEIVAEYAVDLAFAFSVEQGTTTTPHIVTYPFDDLADNQVYATNAPTNVANVGPQRIRSVRARVVTRTALADRSLNIPLVNYGTQHFIYRYCMLPECSPSPAPGVLQWARTRTLTLETALNSLARSFY